MTASAQVETLLKGQDPEPTHRNSPPQPLDNAFAAPIADEPILDLPDLSDLGGIGGHIDGSFPASTAPGAGQPSQMLYPPQPTAQGNSNSPWDLISLGLEEPLPSQDVVDELYVLYAAFYLDWSLIQWCRLGMLYSSRRSIQ
jgi:hypothetical protein